MLLDTKVTPILGGGLSYIGGRGGYEAIAGLRFALAETDKVGIALVAMMAARSSPRTPRAATRRRPRACFRSS